MKTQADKYGEILRLRAVANQADKDSFAAMQVAMAARKKSNAATAAYYATQRTPPPLRGYNGYNR